MARMPPGTYFISHSYKDAAVRDRMLELLLPEVKPFIFPPIKVGPAEFVSNALIEAILRCDAMIVMEGGFSEKSFWVALERDVALRAEKPVILFDQSTSRFEKDRSSPLDPIIYYSLRRGVTEEIARKTLDFMFHERNFGIYGMGDTHPRYSGHVWLSEGFSETDHMPFRDAAQLSMTNAIDEGGYAVFFWVSTRRDEYPEDPFRFEFTYAAKKNRAVVAQLQDAPLPAWVLDSVSSDLAIVPMYEGQERSLASRIDDLIVRLYWLMFQNTRHTSFD